jgi:hypothetical protein
MINFLIMKVATVISSYRDAWDIKMDAVNNWSELKWKSISSRASLSLLTVNSVKRKSERVILKHIGCTAKKLSYHVSIAKGSSKRRTTSSMLMLYVKSTS